MEKEHFTYETKDRIVKTKKFNISISNSAIGYYMIFIATRTLLKTIVCITVYTFK